MGGQVCSAVKIVKRDARIELWRCICMFAVVMGHVAANNNVSSMYGYMWHIPGFLLISGYFGVRFTWAKFLRLILLTYACYYLTIPLRVFFGFEGWRSLSALLVPQGGWFLPFYIVLMIMSPLLNAICLDRQNRSRILMSTAILFLLGWFSTLDGSHVGFGRVPGMQGNGLLLILSVYLAGSVVHTSKLADKLHWVAWMCIFVVGIVMCAGVGMICPVAIYYGSPITVLTAVAGMMAFLRLPELPPKLASVINFISPSMFSIYLLSWCCLRPLQYFQTGGYARVVIHAALFFGFCLAIDMVRRCLAHLILLPFRKRGGADGYRIPDNFSGAYSYMCDCD